MPSVESLLSAFTNYDFLAASVPVNVEFGAAQIVSLCLAVVALFVSGFVSGSEIAFFSITPQQAEELDESTSSQRIKRLLATPERLLATILIANNLVNVTIVVLMSFALSELFAMMKAQLPKRSRAPCCLPNRKSP